MATSARNWKRNNVTELNLPSGNTCLVKRPGLEKLLGMKILPDNLTPMAMEAVEAAQTGPKQPEDHLEKKGDKDPAVDPELMKKFLADEGSLLDLFASFDKITAMVVIEPKVVFHMREILDDEGNPKKTVDGKVAMEEIPLHERFSDEHAPTHPYFSQDPPLYTDDVDSEDKQFIFNFVIGGDRDVEKFRRDTSDAVATLEPGEVVPLPSE